MTTPPELWIVVQLDDIAFALDRASKIGEQEVDRMEKKLAEKGLELRERLRRWPMLEQAIGGLDTAPLDMGAFLERGRIQLLPDDKRNAAR
jgi:hypothetical protein